MDQLHAALADPERLRLYARIVLDDLPAREADSAVARKHLGRLLATGLVERLPDGSLRADSAVFRRSPDPVDAHDRPTVPRRLTGFFAHGRLTAIPVRPVVRHELLVHLTDTLFDADRTYSEGEVNDAFRTVHDDTAALRRYCVTDGLLVRDQDGSSYRRVLADA
ncbi:DUF2087 domain-containing protein [Streptomyces sp. SID335]|uniref:DUF2087 domain-containing protein n=1 Tax=Streptomyces venezuelae TaxID=54571 RepID=A0A5P2B909_STRVZ|nr:DUF2087 domain-containing protein [Streptomyces sp. SID335]MYZ17677.1 DUF2087 domain-containing protein [Streptomyces sp. SID337]NDZ87882.1 DUF2087 domain-containing protein [Streptomyces sp. SID10115]NEA00704.1 DUF2087 domain-containing protein [Streptomyces sp. SID10116]NEB46191.1 DUF2087 domain-containing protein [Streptomyces sp. SID339]QES26517.1 hypothetical protein DEJ47_08595 [Streptomyces venezuelae]